jgi:hypothetical protein
VIQFEDVGQRYKGLKGKYWPLFSEYVRRRDFIAHGRCISCGKPVSDWREFDAGHFISAGGGGFAILFDERNVNGECQYDNAFNQNHLLLYRRGLDARYGAGTADALEERYRDSHFRGKTTKEWSKKQYEAEIEKLQEKLAGLSF